MNKTITSNIAGYVFYIDENAFVKLDAYLNTIRSYFANSQGKDDIIADIEARLAEMLHEKIGSAKEVVTLDDVNHVIQIMGQPEAFIEDDPDTAAWSDQRNEPRQETTGTKRLFRDPDNRVIGGVCSGVSHYLGIGDAIWLRLVLIVSFFLLGSGFLLYIILWIIIPEASTTADKLQMRGEHVTVSNIEKRVNEELETVKNKWNEFHGNNGAARKVGNAFHRFITLILNLATMFLKFIAKFAGFILLFVGTIGLLSVIGILLGIPTIISFDNPGGISSVQIQDILNNIVGGTDILIWIMITGILICGVPLLVIALTGLRLLFNFRLSNKGIVLPIMMLWIVGIVMSFALTMTIMSDFSSTGSNTETIELQFNPEPDKAIVLALNHELGDDEPNVESSIFDLNLITSGNSTQIYGKPELRINLAKSGDPKLIVKRMARAKKKLDAVERASKIDYGFIANDTALLINGYFAIQENELWRSQSVELELLLPVGYTVYLSDEIKKVIYDIDNVSNTPDRKMVGRRWIMTPIGLECVDCDGLKNKKHQNEETDTTDNLEELEKELEEQQENLERKARQLEREMENLERQLEKRQEQSDEEMERMEEADNSEGILLKRVITASYKLTPTIFRQVSISYLE